MRRWIERWAWRGGRDIGGAGLLLVLLGATPAGALPTAAPARAWQGGVTPAAADSLFTVDDAVDLVRVSDPQLSPDGSRVVYVRSAPDWDKNKVIGRLWIVGSDGKDARPFTGEDDDAQPHWSPDGRWLAFLRAVGEKDKTRQLFLIPADGGEARQLTRHATSLSGYQWTHDSRHLVFVATDSLSAAAKKVREHGDDDVAIDEGPNGQSRGEWSNLWMVDADPDSAAERPITRGERIIGDFDVAPVGDRVAFTFRTENRRNADYLSEIAVVDVASGAVRQLTHNQAPESRLAWSPDGKSLLFMAPDLETWKLSQGNLYLMDVATGAVRRLLPDYAGDIRDVQWTADGHALDIVALEKMTSNFRRLDLATGGLTELTHFDGVVGAPSYTADHGRVAFDYTTSVAPADIDVSLLPAAAPVRVTDANPQLRGLALSTPDVVSWKSSDGQTIQGLLYLPGGRAHPRAFVLHVHGGPAGVYTRSFSADDQVLAAMGYAVLDPNVRGSTGYGDAFLRGNTDDIGGGDYHDLMTGVDAMIRKGIAAPDSLAIKGWSYGAILGGWTITQTTRFKAASLGAMVTDWRAEYGPGFNYDVTRWYLGGDPWSKRAFWIERSSFNHADRVKTPTILFHGARDNTDTPAQSFDFEAALRHFNVPVRFLLFPREPHGFREPHHNRIRLVEELKWFEKWVRGREWAPPGRAIGGSVAAGGG
jgi:dipeptidyl aminopeptidase/acylaminoacyl peptidase